MMQTRTRTVPFPKVPGLRCIRAFKPGTFRNGTVVGVLLLLLSCVPLAHAAVSLEDVFGKIPVQHGGRVKPFASFAKESVLLITGKSSFEKQDPTTLVWRWIAEPEAWSQKPLLPVTYLELRKYFSSVLVQNRISPVLVLNDLEFKKLVGQAQVKQEKEK